MHTGLDCPPAIGFETFTDAGKAVERLRAIYQRNTSHIARRFHELSSGSPFTDRVRAYYPEVRLTILSHERLDSRLAYGFVPGPGSYSATITRPDLFEHYLVEQLGLIIRNHGTGVEVGESATPIPLHFALPADIVVEPDVAERIGRPLRDAFDVPDLKVTDDAIVNGARPVPAEDRAPLAPFTAPRIDYSLARLQHYTATRPEYFQNFVLFTNYQFYIDEFIAFAKRAMLDPASDYEAFVEPGNVTTPRGSATPTLGAPPPRMPQMPAYHLMRSGHTGITMVNIGIGPSNAKTITDHVAVLRPHAWIMLGHCAGLRNTQKLGDYVLAHAYVRDDHVLDADLPIWVPIPALSEVQVALERSVAEVTGLTGFELKSVMRTGTVATIDNRNWELLDQGELVIRFSQSRAIALDMESATIAANGFRFRVPYGTLLCVSDKPLHGELKLPGMANEFYRRQVNQHLQIGIRTMERLRSQPSAALHSRKLRSFEEVAFQ
jgi:AMP nucleosidase